MTIKSRIEKLPPAVDWDALPMLLDEKEAALVLGSSISFLRKARCEGCNKVTLETRDDAESAPPFVKLGGRVKYPSKDLREWADGLPRKRVI
jgi:hypothetical protein